ncbi:hypothetical protein RUM44_012408 [Polyplax serrata]|uniref:LIM zinc-binding domain-containing protein n=1 Tax=Polyplax serrata TaxID=468196 RepID=A0ABR1BB72_POLSC
MSKLIEYKNPGKKKKNPSREYSEADNETEKSGSQPFLLFHIGLEFFGHDFGILLGQGVGYWKVPTRRIQLISLNSIYFYTLSQDRVSFSVRDSERGKREGAGEGTEFGRTLPENGRKVAEKLVGRCSEVPGGLPGTGGMLLACAGCDKPILDKFLLNVLDRTWHAECVRCHDCRAALADKCFSREGKLFCRNDFFR